MSVKKLILTVVLLCVIFWEVISVFTIFDVIGTDGLNRNTQTNGINTPFYFFGEYPQTVKEEKVIISDAAMVNGYYVGSDGAYYVKAVAAPYDSDYTFSNGETIVSGAEYYFKVEPICWRVLAQSNGTVTLLCDTILASRAFDEYNNGDYSNNYAQSDIRDWLNNTFYETAFTAEEKGSILETNVDNSAASTGAVTNEYACANTYDKVFLLSLAELADDAFGFTQDTRKMSTSDFSRATGAYMNTSNYYGYGWWWTRSPYMYGPTDVYQVSYDGSPDIYVSSVRGESKGIVPAMRIQID